LPFVAGPSPGGGRAGSMAASTTRTRMKAEPAATPDPSCTTHVLEIFPVARRWRPGVLRNIVYTSIWNTLIALVFTGMSLLFGERGSVLAMLWITFVIAQCVGFVIHGLFLIGDRLLPGIHKKSIAARFAYYTTVPIIGVMAGYPIAAHILGWRGYLDWLLTPRSLAAMLFLSLTLSGVLLAIFVQRERAVRAEMRLAQDQARIAAAERQTVLAQLKLLEAQVEPHFLYNTLANAISLIDTDPAAAKRMLERLIELLRATAAAPQGDGTLGEQLRWLRAYFDILALRMGSRLRWSIDVPDSVQSEHVPPMLLQPIVENAVKHGIEPKIEGGRVEIVGRREGDTLRLAVRDTGLGFRTTSSGASAGLGLPNLRARLAAWYGPAAQLVIEDNRPAGASVSLILPAARS
jgi:signal transduction histidine kinase